MIAVSRGNAPQELVDALRRLSPDQRVYSNLHAEEIAAVKEALLKAQGHLCAYCMRRVPDVEHAKLEHVYPQSLSIAEGHPEKTVDYNNMLATCKGGDGEPGCSRAAQTCDTHKGGKTISIDPSSQEDIDTIFYERNGEIHSKKEEFDTDLCETLNLNCHDAFLPQDRARVYEMMSRQIKRANPKTRDAKRRFAEKKLLEIESSPVKEQFVGVMIYRLKRWAR